jgi:hypothetical protein
MKNAALKDVTEQELRQRLRRELTLSQRIRSWFWSTRFGLSLRLLRGRSIMYKIHVKDGTVMIDRPTSICNCYIEHTQKAVV